MSIQMVLLPVFVQVLLTFILLFWMGRHRYVAVKAKQVKIVNEAASEYVWPPMAAQASRSFHSQFETPLLFFALVALAILTKKDDALFVVMEWLWVVSRVVHALIHTTVNRVSLRFPAFFVGVVILFAMWIIFAVRILAA